jgi:hypothetical protein
MSDYWSGDRTAWFELELEDDMVVATSPVFPKLTAGSWTLEGLKESLPLAVADHLRRHGEGNWIATLGASRAARVSLTLTPR